MPDFLSANAFYSVGYNPYWDDIEPSPGEVERQVQDAQRRSLIRQLRAAGVTDGDDENAPLDAA